MKKKCGKGRELLSDIGYFHGSIFNSSKLNLNKLTDQSMMF